MINCQERVGSTVWGTRLAAKALLLFMLSIEALPFGKMVGDTCGLFTSELSSFSSELALRSRTADQPRPQSRRGGLGNPRAAYTSAGSVTVRGLQCAVWPPAHDEDSHVQQESNAVSYTRPQVQRTIRTCTVFRGIPGKHYYIHEAPQNSTC